MRVLIRKCRCIFWIPILFFSGSQKSYGTHDGLLSANVAANECLPNASEEMAKEKEEEKHVTANNCASVDPEKKKERTSKTHTQTPLQHSKSAPAQYINPSFK